MNILTEIHGRLVGISRALYDGSQLLISKGGHASGVGGKQRRHGSPNTVELWDDFEGDVISDQWDLQEGTDSATSGAAILAGGIGGILRITTGDAGTGLAADMPQLTRALQWQASNGDLCFEIRISLSQITEAYCFVGFTDLAASLEAPIISANSANTITTNATDAVGFMFDTRMTDDNWWLVGVATNVDATHQNSGYAPVVDTFEVLRVEVSSAGTARFFRNGVPVGTIMSGAVTAAADLTPTINVGKLSTATSFTSDVDYVHVSMTR